MRSAFDFTPMFRSSVGFDRIFHMLENPGSAPVNWPPYDIQKAGEDHYRITMVVAGFSRENLTISAEPHLLVVKGEKPEGESGVYLYRSIDSGTFEHRFELADHVEVRNASLNDGLLVIDLVREIPEAMKPKRIDIREEKAPSRIAEKRRAAA